MPEHKFCLELKLSAPSISLSFFFPFPTLLHCAFWMFVWPTTLQYVRLSFLYEFHFCLEAGKARKPFRYIDRTVWVICGGFSRKQLHVIKVRQHSSGGRLRHFMLFASPSRMSPSDPESTAVWLKPVSRQRRRLNSVLQREGERRKGKLRGKEEEVKEWKKSRTRRR